MNSFCRANLLRLLLLLQYAYCGIVRARNKPKLVHYSIPELRELKNVLGYNEDTYLNFTELATKYEYPSEQHSVTTDDGYILTLFRILPKCSETSETRRHPVLLMHGIMDSSDLWIVAGPKTGLGYILSKHCYDVWAANHRGNRYSRKHIRWDPDTDTEYWNYSFDEHGNYDLPALVDYVIETSGRPRLYYLGHSQGTTDFFAMASLKPEYNDKIDLSIHLAPVAWLRNLNNPLLSIVAQGTSPIRTIIEAAGYNEFLARDQILHSITEFVCQKYPNKICGELLSLTTGYKIGTIRSKTLAVAFGHLVVGISSKSLAHFGQLVVSKNFQRFDEGREGNIKRYGLPKPPKYNISKISSPVVLVNAKNDLLSSLKDSNILRSRLPNLLEDYIVPEKYWSHHNHIWGIKAPTRVFPKILEYFDRLET